VIFVGAVLIGAIIGLLTPITITNEVAIWFVVAFFCVVDAFLTELNIYLSRGVGTHVLTRIVFNFIFGFSILYIGARVGFDLYIVVIIPFAIRVLNNINWLKEHVADVLVDRNQNGRVAAQGAEQGREVDL